MVAIILAAGYATRLYPLTRDKPKALLEIGGVTMLDRIIDKLSAIKEVTLTAIISNDKFYGQFLEWEKRRAADGADTDARGSNVIILNDGTKSESDRLGAIGDIKYAIDRLAVDDEIIVIAGDNLFTFDLTDLYAFYKKMDADCVSVKKMDDREAIKSMGVAVVTADMKVVDFEEKPASPKSDIAVYAIYVYKRDTLPLFKTYLDEGNPHDAPGHFPAWLCKRRLVAAYAFDGECYDVGTVDAYNSLNRKYAD